MARKSDVGNILRSMNWEVDEIDILRNPRDDLTKEKVRASFLKRIASNEFETIISSPPCDTFSRVKYANNLGPSPIRSFTQMRGFPWMVGAKRRQAELGNLLADFCFDALILQTMNVPGIAVMEFPEDLGSVRTGKFRGVRPASLWQWPPMTTFRAAKNFKEYGILQSDFAAQYLKPTRIAMTATASAATLYEGEPQFDSEGYYLGPIPHKSAADLGLQTLARKPGDKGFRTTGTAAWPPDLCLWVAKSIDTTARAPATPDMHVSSNCDFVRGSATTSPETSTASKVTFPTFLPEKGYWVGGKGEPRKTYTLGRWKAYHDGASLVSAGRWTPENRVYPQGDRWEVLRSALHDLLCRHEDIKGQPWGLPGIQRALLRLCCTPGTDVFPQELLVKGRGIVKEWISGQCGDYNCNERDVTEGQPFTLKIIFHLLREMRDPDFELFRSLQEGVTLGVKFPLPRNPVLFEEQTKWRLPYDPCADVSEAANYVSLALYADKVHELFVEEAALGMMAVYSNEDYYKRFGKDTAVSALAVIEEQGGAKLRVLHDGSNKVLLNQKIRGRDKLRMPSIPEKHTQMRERRSRRQYCISLLMDFSKAHRRVKILEAEHGFLGCRLNEKDTWVNLCGTFGMASASYWWARLAGSLVRLLHGLLGARWVIELLLFADDGEFTAATANEREGIVMSVFVLLILGSPLKNSKFRGGFEINWIGLSLNNKLYSAGLSRQRADWLIGWCRAAIDGKTVEVTSFAGGVGRMNFAATALLHEKPWLGPLYSWAATIQATGLPTATVPWGIKFILHWLAKRLATDCRLLVTPSLPIPGGHLFKSDAKAEAGRATIGGWECRGQIPPILARWFQIEIFAETTPWVFEKHGDPQRIIAALELLGSLLCLILFDFKAESPHTGILTISGTTDNLGNSFAMQKCMSTKWPLSPLLIELGEQLRTRQLELHLEWQRRDANVEADQLTNEDYSSFSACNRIAVEFTEVQWLILNEAMVWSKEIYDLAQAVKTKRKEGAFTSLSAWKRGKTAAKDRLKTRDPW